jgi:hypothetical protein
LLAQVLLSGWPGRFGQLGKDQIMATKSRFTGSGHRSALATPVSFDATALGAQLGTTLVQVVQTRTMYADRCHQREVLLDAAIRQAQVWDAEAERRHQAFQGTLALATTLAESGHVDQALAVLAHGTALLPPMEAGPAMLTALTKAEVA